MRDEKYLILPAEDICCIHTHTHIHEMEPRNKTIEKSAADFIQLEQYVVVTSGTIENYKKK